MGDVDGETASHPQIEAFTVEIDGNSTDFKIHRMEKTGFKLSPKAAHGDDFVYYFEVDFPEGITRIHHTYRFRGGSSVEVVADYSYRLTTGTMWANGEIGDFELNIDMGPGIFFSVPNTFFENLEPANWKVTGTGRLGKEAHTLWGAPFRMVRTMDGKVQLKRLHFKPEYDLFLAEWHKFNEVSFWGGSKDHPFVEMGQLLSGWFNEEDLEDLSSAQLRLLRNYFFAWHGYQFNSKDLRELFTSFDWYFPNPETKANPDLFTDQERKTYEQVLAEEKRRK